MKKSLKLICKRLLLFGGMIAIIGLNACTKTSDDKSPISFSPAAGAVDSEVTITGGNFSDDPSLITVKFGTAPVTEIVSASVTELKVKVPKDAPAGKVKITVSVGGKESVSADEFTVEADTWKKSFGGDNTDMGQVVCQTADGGYILAGSTLSDKSGDVDVNKGSYDVWIVRTDAYGNKVWQKTYGGTGGDIPNAITGTTDGGFVIAGGTGSSNSGDVGVNHGDVDMWIFKIDASGKIVWQKTLGGDGYENAYDIKNTTDGGFLVAGITSSKGSGDVTTSHGPGSSDIWVVKLDASGKLLWQKAYGGIGYDYGKAIALTADGGFVVAGSAYSHNDGDVAQPNKGLQDLWVIKADANGTLLWQKAYGGTDEDYARGIVRSADGGFVIIANTRSNNSFDVGANHGNTDIWVVKLDANGNLQWQKTMGGSESEDAIGIVNSSDGGYVLLSNTYSNNSGDVGAIKGSVNMWLVKLSANGTMNSQNLLGLDNNKNDGNGDNGYGAGFISVPGSYLVLAAQGASRRPELGTEPDMYIVKTKEP